MAEIKEATGQDVSLIEGSRGIFDVKVDGHLVYSKYATGRHAENGEVGRLVKEAL